MALVAYLAYYLTVFFRPDKSKPDFKPKTTLLAYYLTVFFRPDKSKPDFKPKTTLLANPGLIQPYVDWTGRIKPCFNSKGQKRLMVAKPPSRLQKGEGLVLMISARGDIRAGLAAGLSVRVLFDQHCSRLGGMSYRQFCRYVDRLRHHDPDPDLVALRTVRPAGSATPLPSPARPLPPESFPPPTSPAGQDTPDTIATPKENSDGPKAAPRPRTFTRLGGIADDHKDKLI